MNLHVSRVHPEHCPEDSQADLSRGLSGEILIQYILPIKYIIRRTPLEDSPQRTPPRGLPQRTLPRGTTGGSSGESRPQNRSQSLFFLIGDSSLLFILIQYIIRRTPLEDFPQRTPPRGLSPGDPQGGPLGNPGPRTAPKPFFENWR